MQKRPAKAKKNWFHIIGMMILASGLNYSAWAEDTPSTENFMLDPIVVSATREKSNPFDVSASIDLIGQEALERSQAVTLKDAIGYLPNVDFDNHAMAPIQRPSIRGLDQNQIIIKLDGIRQTFRGSGGIGRNPAQIDAALLKGIEVLRGPSSTLHGSGGMGGVIAMRTKDASDFLHTGQGTGYTLRTGFLSATEDYSVTMAAYGKRQTTDILAAGTYHDTGDYHSSSPGPGSAKIHQDGHNESGLFKISTQAGADHQLGLAINLYQDKLETVSSLYRSSQQQITGTWGWLKEDGIIDLQAAVQFMNREDEMTNEIRNLEDDFNSIGFDVSNTFSGEFSEKNSWKLTVGTDGAFDHQNGTDLGEPDPSRPDARAEDLGIFSRLAVNFSNTLTITPALRYTHYQRDAAKTTAEDQSDDQWSPRVTARWTPITWLNLFCTYAETYRAPTMDEIYFEMDYPTPPDRPSIRVIPNPDLKPETAKTFEGGFGVSLDHVAGRSDQLQLKAVYFQEKVYDFIGPSTTPTITPDALEYTTINLGEVRRHGLEFDLAYRWQAFFLNAAYGVVKGEDEDSDEKTGSVPQKLVLSLGWELFDKNMSLYWRSQFVDDTDYVLYSEADKVPGYATHGMGLVWLPAVSWASNLRLDAGIDNLFDREYVDYRGGTDKGMNVKIGCSLSF